MAKQVLADRTGLFPQNRMNSNLLRLLGEGLVLANGDDWQRHRKVVHPAFNMDKLKIMTATMADCAQSMVSGWEAQLQSQGKKGCHQVEIELSGQFEELTADVISHTAFGSSYREGKQVFEALKELQFIAFSTLFNVQIPGFRYLPTEKNRKVWKLDKEVRNTLMQIIKNRLAAKDKAGYGNDLLGLMLEACAPERGGDQLLSMDVIIDECKTFFFAGQETTSHLLSWTMFLLSTHPEWQQRLREEVLRECGGRDQAPTHDMLNKLKLVSLFLLEMLRLYSPVPLIRRRTRSPVELGGITVPEDTILTIPIATMHRDKEVWGEDASEFNPLRFDSSGGATKKGPKHLSALLAFSTGPRACIGQNFAMIEARAVVAAILQRFALTLSPEYVHAPTDVITLRPKYGLPMIVTSFDA
ncbi:cytochrome P450 709B2-like [Phragmites australis]|uniref:cytochrome P450 709B2-like n=1 Tax=Phragmites australis TaxID=29695 RepID=UPI002D778A92|nr:cytochrome P450 709B2-like [Phragmites australis]